MKILATLEESVNLEKLNGVSRTQLLNGFFSNYLASLILLKLCDLKGLMLVNDRAHSKLTSFSKNMSEINLWGRALFCSDNHDVKARIGSELSSELKKVSKRIVLSRIHQIMSVPMTDPEHLNWTPVIESLVMLKYVFNYHSSYFDLITKTLAKWDTINVAAREQAIGSAFIYLQQSDPSSRLTAWFRSQTGNVLNRLKSAQKIVKFRRLAEEDGGVSAGDGGVGTSTGNVASSNAIVNPEMITRTPSGIDMSGMMKLVKKSDHQVSKKKSRLNFHNGKVVVKRKKNFNPKKFKAPDFMKAKADTTDTTDKEGKENEVE